MSHEQPEPIELPTELKSWLDEYADQTDQTFESALARSVMALRLIDEGDPSGTLDDGVDDLLDRLAAIETRVDAVEDTLDADAPAADAHADIEAVESRLTDEIEDTRSRIIDVLREAKSKADADHHHPELAAADHDHPALSSRLETIESMLEALEEDLSSGFDNYETILEAHDESIVALEAEIETIGEAIEALGSQIASIEQVHATREQVRELKQEANKKNVTQGKCEECGHKVTLSLLEKPQCPHCASRFSGVDPGRRFIGRPTVETADHLALESGTDTTASEEQTHDRETEQTNAN